jgi:hypothetical protein
MSVLRGKAFRHYLFGIACVAVGAQISSMTNSMLPLAMGSAVAIMTTLGLVKAIRARKG